MKSTIAAIFLVVCFAQAAAGQPAASADLGLMKLQVERAEVVDKIEIGGGGMGTPIAMTPKSGYRLWIVTLKGSVPKPCTLAVAPIAFLAAWDTEQDIGGHKSRAMNFEPAHHVKSGDRWVASYSTEYARAMSEERIVIAVTLPDDVKEFHMTYATFAPGVAGGAK